MKRIISFVLCLSMLLSMVPVTGFAAEVEETAPVTESVPVEESTAYTEAPEEETTVSPETTVAPEESIPETTETTVPSETETVVPETTEETVPEETEAAYTAEVVTWIPDPEVYGDEAYSNDALFAGYVEQQFYGNSISTFGTNGRDKLEDNEGLQDVYDALAKQIKRIAVGERESAVIAVGMNLGDCTFTNGDGTSVTYPCHVDEEDEFDVSDVDVDLQVLLDVLLEDFPYELYWFDKTAGVSYTSISDIEGTCYLFYFYVSANYSATGAKYTTDVDTELTSAAPAAAKNALAIVSKYQSESDYNKLLSYKDEICALTDYNHSAVQISNTPYGDPWQMIWVFDNNPDTLVVCEGYSKAFQYLCETSQFDNTIDCYSISGYLNPTATSSGAHMWNVVRVNDTDSYLVDVTNCDTGFDLFLRGGEIAKGAYYYEYVYDEAEDVMYRYFRYDDTVYGTYTIARQNFVYDRDDTLGFWGSELLTLAAEDASDFPEAPKETEPSEPSEPETEPTEPEETIAMTGEELVALLESQTEGMYTLVEPVVVDSDITLPDISLFIRGNGSITVKDGGSLTLNNSLDVANGGSLTVEAGGSLTVNSTLSAANGGTITVLGSYILEEDAHVALNYPGSISGIETSSINFFAPVWDEASLLDALTYQGYASSELIIAGSVPDQDGNPVPVILTEDLTIPAGWSFVVGDEMGTAASLQLADGVTLTIETKLSICPGASLVLGEDAVLTGSGQVLSDGTIRSFGTIECAVTGTVTEYMSRKQFLSLLNSETEFTVSSALILDGPVNIPEGKYVYFEDGGSLTVADGAKLTVEGDVSFISSSLTVQPGGSLTLAGQGYLTFIGGSALTIEEGASYAVLGEAEIYADMGTLLTGITKGEVVNSNSIENPEDNLQEVAEALGEGYKKFYLTLYTDYVVSEDMTLPENVVLQQFGNTLTITNGATLTVNGDWELDIEVIVFATEQVGGHIVVQDGTLITNGDLELKHGSTLTLGRNASYTANRSFSVDTSSSVTNNGTVTVNGSMSQNGSWSGNSAKELNNAPETQTELEAQLKTAKGSVCVTVPLTLTKDLTVPEGVTLILTGDGSITIPAQRTLTNNGTILLEHSDNVFGIINTLGGTLLNNGTIRNEGKMDLSEGVYQSGEDAQLILAYLNHDGGTDINSELRCGDNEAIYSQVTMVLESWREAHMRYVLNLAADYQPRALQINICGDMALNTVWYGSTLDLPEYATLTLADLGYGPASLTLPAGYTLTNEGAIEVGENGTLLVQDGAVLTGNQPVLTHETAVYTNEGAMTQAQLEALLSTASDTVVLNTPVVLETDLQIPSGVVLELSGKGNFLTIPETVTLYNYGEIHCVLGGGLMAAGGTLANDGYIYSENKGIVDLTDGTYTEDSTGNLYPWYNCDAEGNITCGDVSGVDPEMLTVTVEANTDEAIIREAIAAFGETGTALRDFQVRFTGNAVLSADLTLPDYASVTIPADSTLTVPAGIMLTVESEMEVSGTLIAEGTVTATNSPIFFAGQECVVHPENCTNYFIDGTYVESITIETSPKNPRVGSSVSFSVSYYPIGALNPQEILYEVISGSGTLDETNVLTADVPGPVTVMATIMDYDENGEPVKTEIYDEITVVFYNDRQVFPYVSGSDFYADGCDGLFAGSSIQLYPEVYGGEHYEEYIECDTLQMTLEGGDGFVTLTEKDGIYTLKVSKDLPSYKEFTIHAFTTDSSACPYSFTLCARPKASSVDVLMDGAAVTNQTVLVDLNRNDEPVQVQLFPAASPADACILEGLANDLATPLVQWKSSNEDIATVDQDTGLVTFTGKKTGKVKITMTANFGSKKTAVMTFNAVKLVQSIEPSETNAAQLIGGSSATYTVYDVTDPKQTALKSSVVKWFLCDKDGNPIDSHPYASITAAGKLTTKAVADEINVYLMAQVVGNEDIACLSEPVLVELYPAVSTAQIQVGTTPISGTLLYDTSVLGKQYPLSWSAGPYLESVKDISWKSSAPKVAEIDEETGEITVCANSGTAKFTLTVTALNNKKTTATVTMKFGVFTRGLDLSAKLPGEKETTDELDYLTIYSGESITFYAENAPANVTTSGVNWSLDSTTYATISSTGTLKTKSVTRPVMVTVLAQSKDGSPEGNAEIPVLVLPKKTSDDMETMVLYTGDTEEGYSFLTKTTRALAPKDTLQVYASDYTFWNDEAYNGFEIAAAEDVEWSSAKPAVATVDADGVVTAVAAGTAKITATDGFGRTAYFTVKVSKTSVDVSISQKKTGVTKGLEVASGKSLDLVGTVTYTDDSTDTKVNWSVSDTSLATISSSGKLTAAKNLKNPATVTVWAYAKDGSPMAFDSISVRILPLTTAVEIFGSFGSFKDISNTTQKWDLAKQSNTFDLNAKIFPEGAMGVTWKSSNNKIVPIDPESGKVQCPKPGTVTITATAKDGSNKKASFKLTVYRSMTSLTLPETAIIGGGKSLTLTKLDGYGIDNEATNKKLSWTLTYPDGTAVPKSVASISASGVLSTKKLNAPLTLYIQATTTDGSKLSDLCIVTVYPITTKVSIVNAPATIPVNSTVALTAQATPSTGSASFTWKSGNSSIASVDENTGVVTAHAPGAVRITATARDGSNKSASVLIKVVPKVTISGVPAQLQLNGTADLDAEYAPYNSAVSFTWHSSDPGIVYVHEQTGFIQANHTGTAVITATASDGTQTSVEITVVPVTFKVSLQLPDKSAGSFTFTSYSPYLDTALLNEEFITGEYDDYPDGAGLHRSFYIESVNGIVGRDYSPYFGWLCCLFGTDPIYESFNIANFKIIPGGHYLFWASQY